MILLFSNLQGHLATKYLFITIIISIAPVAASCGDRSCGDSSGGDSKLWCQQTVVTASCGGWQQAVVTVAVVTAAVLTAAVVTAAVVI